MDNIVLERDNGPNIMKLNPEEEEMLNEIEIDPVPMNKRPKRPLPPKKRMSFQPQRQQATIGDLEAFTNPNKMTTPSRPPPEYEDHGMEPEESYEGDGGYDDGDDDMGGGGGGGGGGEMPSGGYTTIEEEKADLLNKLARYEKKGIQVNKKLNAYSTIEELRTEYTRISYGIEVDQSIRFSRRMLIACTTGLEFVNKRYNPIDVHLDGWSESIMENVDDYDGVFEELYVKYKSKMAVAPEVKLVMMLGGSAMMFHLTNSMFKAAMPNMNDVLKQNPDLLKNMMSAVQNTSTRQTPEDPSQRLSPVDPVSGRREMQGPAIDLSSLMGGIMMPPPPPMNTSTNAKISPILEESIIEDDMESVSDIISVSGGESLGDVKDVNLSTKKSRGRPRKSKKTEINM